MSAPHPRPVRSGRDVDVRLLRAAVFAAVCVVLAAAGHALASCATVPLWTLTVGFLGVLAAVVPLAGRERSLPGIAALLAVGQTVLHTLFGVGQLAHSGTTTVASSAAASDATLVARAARLVCGATAAPISPARARSMLIEARLYTGDHGTGSQTDPMAGMSGMGGMGGAMHHPADALSTAAGSSMSLLPSLPMLLAHVLAALATGWLLRRGDAALRRLIQLSAHGIAEGALVRSLRGALALVRALLGGLPATPGTEPHAARTAFRAPPKPRTSALQHTVIRRGPPDVSLFVLAA
ncbi:MULTISPECIES: hypothetical protein [Streptomyces]|uniref:Integral membrane protein n=2 Tax=Streptomyces TaxID=1883 RepID=A0ABV9IQ36_9ACTN